MGVLGLLDIGQGRWRRPRGEGTAKMQVWLERYLLKRKVVFSAQMKCLRIGLRAQCTQCTMDCTTRVRNAERGDSVRKIKPGS
jgi:hypothetical protein